MGVGGLVDYSRDKPAAVWRLHSLGLSLGLNLPEDYNCNYNSNSLSLSLPPSLSLPSDFVAITITSALDNV